MDALKQHEIIDESAKKKSALKSLKKEIEELVGSLPSRDVYEILKQKKISIERIDADYSFGSLTFYAEYEEKKKNIKLYLPALSRLKENLIEEIALAHELYHVLSKKKEPKNIQEIKANLFAEKFLNYRSKSKSCKKNYCFKSNI